MDEKNTDTNFCIQLKQLKPEIAGTDCCAVCHALMDKSGEPTSSGLCCAVEHRNSLYRPSARRANPLRS